MRNASTRKTARAAGWVLALVISTACLSSARADNYQVIDPPSPGPGESKAKTVIPSGCVKDPVDPNFSISRMGKPTLREYRKMCEEGITEIMVLSGTESDAEKIHYAELMKEYNEKLLKKSSKKKPAPPCEIKVKYESQLVKNPLTEDFLKNTFDPWVQDARKTGKKIAFRCNCGCHRTGRLAAYYQMKYQCQTPEQAISNMKDRARLGPAVWLDAYWLKVKGQLKHQVAALHNYINGKPCGEEPRHCVVMGDTKPIALKDLLQPEREPDDVPEMLIPLEVAQDGGVQSHNRMKPIDPIADRRPAVVLPETLRAPARSIESR